MKSRLAILIFFIVIKSALLATENSGNPIKENNKTAAHLVTGKVIDKISGEEIAGAEIKIGEKTILTDLNGNFVTSIPAVKTTLLASFISYSTTEVSVEPYSTAEVLIQLESK